MAEVPTAVTLVTKSRAPLKDESNEWRDPYPTIRRERQGI